MSTDGSPHDENYELLDFARGRKLELLGGRVVDRPSPAAERAESGLHIPWPAAAARYERSPGNQGAWVVDRPLAEPWMHVSGPVRLELRLTEAGQVGFFPEQRDNWQWLAAQVRRARRPLRVLNLFAYTGGSTLAAAAAGAEVTHVDATRSAVAWARRNAELSGLDQSPIRWIVDDARRFVAREIKRGRVYDGVVLDPPSYGHGAAGQAWNIAKHLEPLLADCRRLTAGEASFMLLTCHAPEVGPAEAGALLAPTLAARERGQIEARRLILATRGGARLDAGVVARWPSAGGGVGGGVGGERSPRP